MTLIQEHTAHWSNCQDCHLCEGRLNVVLWRGQVPCNLLFIGEAPGESEDVVGVPFVGPAGKLLDTIVSEALEGQEERCAFTNLTACIPRDESGDKTSEPDKEAIKACQQRLKEFIAICKPKLVICVGKLAADHVRKMRGNLGLGSTRLVDITHPAAILRQNVVGQPLSIRRCVITLQNALEQLDGE